jgi:hypothetical protein
MRLRNLLRPLYLAGRLQNWIHERRHPDHPWLAPATIVWLEQAASAPRHTRLGMGQWSHTSQITKALREMASHG